MNLGLVAGLLLALLIFAVTVAAMMFYVRHWATRQTQQAPGPQHTEGRFLKRYIPPPLRPTYDKERTSLTHRTLIRRRTVAHLLNIAIVGVALFVFSGTMGVNGDRLLLPIDLSTEEVMALQPVGASWSPILEHRLPNMEERLSALRKRGIAVVVSRADEDRVIGGQRITAMAKAHWQHFFDRWNIPYHLCDWHELSTCLGKRIGLVLPGRWQLNKLHRILQDGASLLMYGPPSSVLTEHSSLLWEGLTFEPFTQGTGRHLALRGDQLLTLGFDAGLILEVKRAFNGYRVVSDSPQAIDISSMHVVGGSIDSRIYAKRIGKGRLVWMDYAPDELDHWTGIDVSNLYAINAAVFRYLLSESYSSWAMWPQGKRFAGMLSEDSEDKYRYAGKVVDLVERHGFPITWFILSNEAQLNRRLTQRMAGVGEVACHGDSHASFPQGDLRSQTERLARCAKVLKKITGRKSAGFRPPKEEFNGDSISAVASLNMSYYFADAGIDRVVPVVMRENGGTRQLVSLPRMGADDYEMWGTLKLNGKESLRIAEDQLKWVSTIGGFLPFDFHTQYMEKAENLAVVEHYGLRFQQPDCFFGTASQIADWWRIRPLLVQDKPIPEEARMRYQPVRLRVDAEGTLMREET